jgi:phage-related tail fiber protein
LQDLQNNLSKITSAPATNFTGKWTKEMQQASTAAMELKTHLQNATNVKTGALDFTKLNQSIQKSNMSISQYGQSLLKLGPAG